MTQLLRATGEALYGPQWQSALARDLGVADRTMRRWAAGTTEPPPGIYQDLLRLVQDRAAGLKSLTDSLKKLAGE